MEETNQNSGIKIAVGVIITLVIVGVIVTLVMKSVNASNQASAKMDTVSAQMDDVYYRNYDGASVSGSEVISAINTKASDQVKVVVVTGEGGNTTYTQANYSQPDSTQNTYIEPTGKFTGAVHRNANHSVDKITFTQSTVVAKPQ